MVQFAENHTAQRASLEVVIVLYKAAVDVFKRKAVIAAAAVDCRKIVKAGFLLGGCPRRLVEGIVGFIVPALIKQGKTEVHHRLAVIRVGVFLRHAFDGLAEVCLAFLKQAAPEEQLTIGVVHADIARVALERLQIIRVGQVCRVAVLLNVQTGQVQLFVGQDFVRQLCGGRGIGNLFDLPFLRRIIKQPAAAAVVYGEGEGGFIRSGINAVFEDIDRAEGQRFVVKDMIPGGQHHARIPVFAGGVDDKGSGGILLFKVQHDFGAGVFYVAGSLVRHEILGECLFLKGLEPCKVGLIVAEHAGHQLDIRSVFIGEISVPCAAEIAVAPCPLLFARGNVMIGDMHDAGIRAVIVAADKVIVAVRAHIAGWHRNILVPGDIHARAVIVLVVNARGDGEGRHVSLTVVIDRAYVRREDGLRVVVHGDSRVCPPQEGLRQIGAVIQLSLDLDIRLAGVYGKGHFALGAVHLIDLGELDGFAAVAVFHGAPVGRGVGGRAVVLRPVEFDAAGNPRAGKADKRRLDDLVVIDEVVAVGLVVGALNAAAKLRKHHHADIVVFKPYGGIGLVGLFIKDLVDDRQGVDLAA